MLSIHEYVQSSVCLQHHSVYLRTAQQLSFQYCAYQALNNDGKWPQVASGTNAKSLNWSQYKCAVWVEAKPKEKRTVNFWEYSLITERIAARQNQDNPVLSVCIYANYMR